MRDRLIRRVGVLALIAIAATGCVSGGGGGGGPTPTTLDPNGRYVATTGDDTGNDCSQSATPCLTIQHAVGQAVAGNTVYVSAGTYAELVSVDKDLSFSGANAGIAGNGARGPESIVKGFRNPGNPGTTSMDVSIDGFGIDPQGDSALISATAQPLVWLRGGDTDVVNNVFNGGTFAPACSFTCTTMTDYAFAVQTGTVDFSFNQITNFRRPVNINQALGAPDTIAIVDGNTVIGVTSRAFSIAGVTGTVMPGAAVVNNTVDGGGITYPTSSPAGITISNAGNTVSGNSFTGLGTGVYIDLCKKFNTDNNQITGNTFTNNFGYGVNINVNTDGGACVSSTVEGSGGWVTGAGKLNGLQIIGNNFSGNALGAIRHAAHNWTFWTTVFPVTTGPIDVSCNWWGAPTGPSVISTNSADPGVPDRLYYAPSPHPVFQHSPWRTAAAPGGACDGV